MVPAASSMGRKGAMGCEPDPQIGAEAETAKFCAGLSLGPRTRAVSIDFKALDALDTPDSPTHPWGTH